MFIQSPPLGKIGLITDPPEHTLPVGAWSSVANVKFNDGYVARAKEPLFVPGSEPVVPDDAIWLDQWIDSTGPQVVYGSVDKLYKWDPDLVQWDDVTRVAPYNPGAYWQSFGWGTSVVFNNGVNPPQILYEGAFQFVDLPNWGMISPDPANPDPTFDTQALCAVLRPYRNFLVAIDITEQASNSEHSSRVWWSSPATETNSELPGDNPSWDYADLGTLSGFNTVAAEDGKLIDLLQLGGVMMLYTNFSATQMQFTGDSVTVMGFSRAIDYGIANIHAVALHDNVHTCVGIDTVFEHDGSTVIQLLDGRVQKGFYEFNPVVGTFQVEHYLLEKEMHFLFETTKVDAYGQNQKYIFVYNYKDNNFTILDAYTGRGADRQYIEALSYGTRNTGNTTWDDLDGPPEETWDDLSITGQTWLQFFGNPNARRMFWLNGAGLHQADADDELNLDKQYYIRRDHIDLSELSPEVTSNLWKTMREIYPHIDTDITAGNGLTRITVSWALTLMAPPLNPQEVIYDPHNTYKADFRNTGRYLGLRLDVVGPGTWRFTSMDFDVDLNYGR
tara:strand:- start:1544 stop:3217 length:1674 start_codon:yes stop_codon:yes gene_type:complete